MITIKNVRTLSGKIEDVDVEGITNEVIDAEGKLTRLPGLIDAHVDFGIPGFEDLEDWKSGAQAAIAGGVTTVFDMPDNIPPCVDLITLHEKKKLIDAQLASIQIPLRYKLYIGARKDHLEDLTLAKSEVIAIKISMDSQNNDGEAILERIFQIGAQNNIMIAVSGETERSISIAEKYGSQVYILNVKSIKQLELIRKAKQRQLLVFAETSPYHLFHKDEDFKGNKEALWKAIQDGTIDSIGSHHTPHVIKEKNKDYEGSGIETMLPLLLNAVNEGKLTLEQVVHLTRINLEYIYTIDRNKDIVLVDMNLSKEVQNKTLKTKCGNSRYAGQILKGWPVYTILKGRIYKIS